jgi:hypothetical protein
VLTPSIHPPYGPLLNPFAERVDGDAHSTPLLSLSPPRLHRPNAKPTAQSAGNRWPEARPDRRRLPAARRGSDTLSPGQTAPDWVIRSPRVLSLDLSARRLYRRRRPSPDAQVFVEPFSGNEHLTGMLSPRLFLSCYAKPSSTQSLI